MRLKNWSSGNISHLALGLGLVPDRLEHLRGEIPKAAVTRTVLYSWRKALSRTQASASEAKQYMFRHSSRTVAPTCSSCHSARAFQRRCRASGRRPARAKA
jgi:hypothetical protein